MHSVTDQGPGESGHLNDEGPRGAERGRGPRVWQSDLNTGNKKNSCSPLFALCFHHADGSPRSAWCEQPKLATTFPMEGAVDRYIYFSKWIRLIVRIPPAKMIKLVHTAITPLVALDLPVTSGVTPQLCSICNGLWLLQGLPSRSSTELANGTW